MMYFRGARCDLQLTQPLQGLHDVRLINEWDEEQHGDILQGDTSRDLFPRGWYARGALLNQQFGDRFWDDDEWMFNLDDTRNTKLGGVLNGCCGIDGRDGINTFCLNGHEIGTEESDCWTYRDLHVPSANVVAVRIEDGR